MDRRGPSNSDPTYSRTRGCPKSTVFSRARCDDSQREPDPLGAGDRIRRRNHRVILLPCSWWEQEYSRTRSGRSAGTFLAERIYAGARFQGLHVARATHNQHRNSAHRKAEICSWRGWHDPPPNARLAEKTIGSIRRRASRRLPTKERFGQAAFDCKAGLSARYTNDLDAGRRHAYP